MELTFKQFLYEQDNDLQRWKLEVEQFVQAVIQDCQPFLRQFGAAELYRGMQDAPYVVYEKSVHKDRRPRDTPSGIHDVIDDLFKQNFGHYYRSQSIFVKNTERGVGAYGTPYKVFPIGKFSILYSMKYKDLWVSISDQLIPMLMEEGDYSREEAARIAKAEFAENIPERAIPIINRWLKEGDYKKADTKEELQKSFGEQMVLCDYYHAINNGLAEQFGVIDRIEQAMKET